MSELQRYQAGAVEAGVEVSPEQARDDVLGFLMEQTLFRQAAVENGYIQTEEEVTQKIASLVEAHGGQAEFGHGADVITNVITNQRLAGAGELNYYIIYIMRTDVAWPS